MTSDLSTLQRYFVNKATEKARIRNITVNGEKATVVFSEYQAPESDIDDFHREDNSDGHFFYITFYIWNNNVKSYWTDKPVSTEYIYLTDKVEGNKIYRQIKATKKFDLDI